jgi:hypothetical protein
MRASPRLTRMLVARIVALERCACPAAWLPAGVYFCEMSTEAIGWLETIEFVDSSGAVVRQARYFAYPKHPPAFPSRLRSQCFEFVGRAIRMNGELPEGIFVREKFSQLSRVTAVEQLDRLTAYYETTEWRCVRV